MFVVLSYEEEVYVCFQNYVCVYMRIWKTSQKVFSLKNDKYFSGSFMHCEQHFEENCILAVRIKVISYAENLYELTIIRRQKLLF